MIWIKLRPAESVGPLGSARGKFTVQEFLERRASSATFVETAPVLTTGGLRPVVPEWRPRSS